MADRVIIVGLRRGGAIVPSSELKQMIGRAGRDHEDKGVVYVVVNEIDEGRMDGVFEDGGTTVVSSMNNPDLLADALLPDICRGQIRNIDDAQEWCSRSFCSKPPIAKAIELLEASEAIKITPDGFMATDTGRCASKFYFHPADVYAWKVNFHTLFEDGLQDDEIAPAWALGNVPHSRIIGDLGERRELATECRGRIPLGLEVMQGSLINVVCWWYLMGGPSPGPIRLSCLNRRKDFGRVVQALKWLDTNCCKWGMEDFFEDLTLRVKKGIVPELIPLCRCEGIGKGRAEYLYGFGIKGLEDMGDALMKVGDDIDEEFRQTIESLARSSR